MALFNIKRQKPKQENPYAVEHQEEKKDFMEVENEKLDKQMEDELKDTGEEDDI